MTTPTAQKPQDDVTSQPTPQPPNTKEQEPKRSEVGKSEKEILTEIIQTSEAADKQAEAQVQKALSETREGIIQEKGEKEGRLSHPEPKLKADVADAGVKVPQREANRVIKHGTTLNLEIDEQEYQKGLHTKIAGKVKDKVVYGVSSLAALAIWFSKVIKGAHKHTMKVVFRKKGGS